MVPTTAVNSDTETLGLASPASAQQSQSKTGDLPEHSSLFKSKRFLLYKSKKVCSSIRQDVLEAQRSLSMQLA